MLPLKTSTSQTSSSVGAMFQSPTSAICAAGSSASHDLRRIPQRGKPFQLVGVVRIVQRAAVGHVQAPHPHPAARRAECAAWPRRRRRLLHVGLARRSRPATSSSPTRDAIATPFHWLKPDVRDLVAQRGERHRRELVVGALGFLHGQHVDVGALQPVGDPIDSGADRVDVPGGQSHALQATATAYGDHVAASGAASPKPSRLVERDRGGVVGEHLDVGAGRAVLGGPAPAVAAHSVRARARVAGRPPRRAPPTARPTGCRRARR